MHWTLSWQIDKKCVRMNYRGPFLRVQDPRIKIIANVAKTHQFWTSHGFAISAKANFVVFKSFPDFSPLLLKKNGQNANHKCHFWSDRKVLRRWGWLQNVAWKLQQLVSQLIKGLNCCSNFNNVNSYDENCDTYKISSFLSKGLESQNQIEMLFSK